MLSLHSVTSNLMVPVSSATPTTRQLRSIKTISSGIKVFLHPKTLYLFTLHKEKRAPVLGHTVTTHQSSTDLEAVIYDFKRRFAVAGAVRASGAGGLFSADWPYRPVRL